MPKRNLCFDVFAENLASMQEWERQQYDFRHTGRPEYQEMLEVLKYSIKHELTRLQTDCVRMYYFEGVKMKEIAKRIDRNVSSVSRTLKRARQRLGIVMGYAFRRLEVRE